MASRAGKRAEGSDGSDFAHRERVATHYGRSAQLKKNLQKVLYVQLLSFLLVLVTLAMATDYPSLICTAGYALGMPLGWQATKKNSVTLVNLYGVCCSMMGVFPMAYVLYSFLWTHGITSHHYLRFAEAIAVIATNGVGLHFAKELMSLWSTPTTGKKKYR